MPTAASGSGRPADTVARDRTRSARPRRVPWATLAAVSAGGALGALARHGITAAFPAPPGAFAWATFAVNVSGCLLIGALMAAVTDVWRAPPLARPFLGVGVLGGYTTFSAYVADVQRALSAGRPGTALAYLAATLVTALAAVWAGDAITRAAARAHHGRRRP
ncbi:CrcB family protein [Sphaerisporangium sp. TRM90804]|uniref:fluoride efflux transporter FluC n=1 Tax=Sphaerisporangium sp. TRM90804 TaxID=3031113 RepID=UPI00244816C1|nr:CrcB family protein [Sphaerisporangium sp. TRM90804]MDH2425983.1 CrcB family protein [Sphaerisporangium sp. TRM90804]